MFDGAGSLNGSLMSLYLGSIQLAVTDHCWALITLVQARVTCLSVIHAKGLLPDFAVSWQESVRASY
jgi:hypothetical protein